MSVRFEIVRAAQEQWHWRIVSNGRILSSSENYRRKVGCERAIKSVVHATFGRYVPTFYVDDRLHPVARPELPDPGSLS
jgi:uncharacterized protein YegP (UPF0339 family)